MLRVFLLLNKNFNPRSHEGSDCGGSNEESHYCYFNPRSHEGSDGKRANLHKQEELFQSTLPRRERRPDPP